MDESRGRVQLAGIEAKHVSGCVWAQQAGGKQGSPKPPWCCSLLSLAPHELLSQDFHPPCAFSCPLCCHPPVPARQRCCCSCPASCMPVIPRQLCNGSSSWLPVGLRGVLEQGTNPGIKIALQRTVIFKLDHFCHAVRPGGVGTRGCETKNLALNLWPDPCPRCGIGPFCGQ